MAASRGVFYASLALLLHGASQSHAATCNGYVNAAGTPIGFSKTVCVCKSGSEYTHTANSYSSNCAEWTQQQKDTCSSASTDLSVASHTAAAGDITVNLQTSFKDLRVYTGVSFGSCTGNDKILNFRSTSNPTTCIDTITVTIPLQTLDTQCGFSRNVDNSTNLFSWNGTISLVYTDNGYASSSSVNATLWGISPADTIKTIISQGPSVIKEARALQATLYVLVPEPLHIGGVSGIGISENSAPSTASATGNVTAGGVTCSSYTAGWCGQSFDVLVDYKTACNINAAYKLNGATVTCNSAVLPTVCDDYTSLNITSTNFYSTFASTLASSDLCSPAQTTKVIPVPSLTASIVQPGTNTPHNAFMASNNFTMRLTLNSDWAVSSAVLTNLASNAAAPGTNFKDTAAKETDGNSFMATSTLTDAFVGDSENGTFVPSGNIYKTVGVTMHVNIVAAAVIS